MHRSGVQRLAGWSGLAVAALFTLGSLLWWPWGDVRPGATPTAIADFYSRNRVRIVIGGGVSVIALSLFVIFAAAVRHLVPTSRKLSGDIALAGAVVTTVAGLAAETINMGGAVHAAGDTALAQVMYEISQVFGGYTSGVGVGIFALAVAASSLLPRWGAALLGMTGVVLLSPAALFVVEVAGAGLVLVSALVAVEVFTRDS
jgi:nucleoside diphosphate kinase